MNDNNQTRISCGLRLGIRLLGIVCQMYVSYHFYFWRDKTGHEIDFVLDYGTELMPIEAKSGETISSSFFEGLKYFASLGPPASERGMLIHGGNELYEREKFSVRPWWGAGYYF